MPIVTAFKPEYLEYPQSDPASLGSCLSAALDDAGCTDKQIDLKAHRILAKAVYGDYKILCWWAAEQEAAISDGKPMLTVDKEYATLLGICAFPRTGKSGDDEAVARLNSRIKEKIEHHRKLREGSHPA